MKIINLKSENIKGIKAIDVTPQDNTVVLTGANGSGKTSILDSIVYAFNPKSIPDMPIRDGEEEAKITIDCGDFVLTRSFNRKGNSLKIVKKDKTIQQTPQTFLNKIVGRISFDVREFIDCDEKKQAKILMDLVGIDVDDLDVKEKVLFDDKALITKQYRAIKAEFDVLKVINNPPKKEVKTADLFAELEALKKHNKKITDFETDLSNRVTETKGLEDDYILRVDYIAELEETLKDAKENVKTKKKFITDYTSETAAKKIEYSKMKKEPIEPIELKIKNVDKDNENFRAHEKYVEKQKQVKKATEAGTSKAKALEDFRGDRKRKIKEADYPIKGLSFGYGNVIYNNIPVKQCSTGEQYKIGLKVSMALNPNLKVLRITDGSLLDSATKEIITDILKNTDYQVWIEQVDETGTVGVYIEEGLIKKVN